MPPGVLSGGSLNDRIIDDCRVSRGQSHAEPDSCLEAQSPRSSRAWARPPLPGLRPREARHGGRAAARGASSIVRASLCCSSLLSFSLSFCVFLWPSVTALHCKRLSSCFS